ncbi:MAG: response regulator transcription factor [Candidatus Obscuribacterales bacterium]|nr:response regulator transcription factor [Candidatus Obscuribacterales bacterium]
MKVLVIEDDTHLSCQIEDCLTSDNLLVERAATAGDALQLLGISAFDAIILDWNLPDREGIELLRQFRKEGGQTPILMLTGMSKTDDKVLGLEAGADDYLTKPFDMRELLARVQALLRRGRVTAPSVVSLGSLVIDTKLCRAAVDGTVLQLRPKEYALLEFLSKNAGTFFSSTDIHARLWKSDSETTASVVRIWIHRLREKLPVGAHLPELQYAAGRGYSLIPPADSRS